MKPHHEIYAMHEHKLNIKKNFPLISDNTQQIEQLAISNSQLEHATRNMQLTTRNMQLSTRNMQLVLIYITRSFDAQTRLGYDLFPLQNQAENGP